MSNDPGPTAPDPGAAPGSPARVEIIPGALSVRIVAHEIASQHGAIPCWSYVSEGLTGQQQAEVVFTLRREPEEPPDQCPEEPLRLFATIYDVTGTGQRVTSGSFTEFGRGEFFGHHVLYVRAQSLVGVPLPPSCLAALLVTQDELRAVREFGTTRVLARLGQAAAHYPFPPWADRRRRGLSLDRTFEASLLSKLPRASAHDVAVSVKDNQITVAALRSEQLSWSDRLGAVPEQLPLVLLTAFDPAAGGCLAWVPGQKQPEASLGPGSDGAAVCGCFVAFIPGQPGNGGKILEDGFAIELTSAAWQAIRGALIEGKELLLPASPETGDGMSVALTWRDEVYVSPIDVRAYHAHAAGGAARASQVSITAVRVSTSQDELAARASVRELAAFCDRIRDCAQDVLGQRADQADLLIRLHCTPEGHGIQLSGRGEVPREIMAEFFDAMKQLPGLEVRDGEVNFEIDLAVSLPSQPAGAPA